jgi:hypothetical protein
MKNAIDVCVGTNHLELEMTVTNDLMRKVQWDLFAIIYGC